MAPGQDDPVPMSAVGVPEERSGVVATAARAAAVAAAEALSLLVAWSRAKEQLAMVMHDGFKVSKRGGALGREGWEKRPSTPVRPPQLPPASARAPAHSSLSAQQWAKQHVTIASRGGR